MTGLDHRFRFVDGDLQSALLALVEASGVRHSVDEDGALRYASADEELVGNELICSIRSRLFSRWSIFTLEGCETASPRATAAYRAYMIQHGIPFAEEVIDGFTWFLILDGVDSFEWDIPYCDEEETSG